MPSKINLQMLLKWGDPADVDKECFNPANRLFIKVNLNLNLLFSPLKIISQGTSTINNRYGITSGNSISIID
jgi:hypothetical protein